MTELSDMAHNFLEASIEIEDYKRLTEHLNSEIEEMALVISALEKANKGLQIRLDAVK